MFWNSKPNPVFIIFLATALPLSVSSQCPIPYQGDVAEDQYYYPNVCDGKYYYPNDCNDLHYYQPSSSNTFHQETNSAQKDPGIETNAANNHCSPQRKPDQNDATSKDKPADNSAMITADKETTADKCKKCEDRFQIENVHGFMQLSTVDRFRGISYTNNNIYFNGLLLYKHEKSGLYLGYHAGNNASAGTSICLSGIIGIGRKVNKILLDFRYSYHTFPKNIAPFRLDWYEFIAELGYDFSKFVAKAGVSYSPNYYFETGTQWYPYVNIYMPLGCRFFFSGEIGYQYLADWEHLGLNPHAVYDFSIGRDFKGFVFGLRYVRTSLSHSSLFYRFGKPVLIAFLRRDF